MTKWWIFYTEFYITLFDVHWSMAKPMLWFLPLKQKGQKEIQFDLSERKQQ